MFLSEDADTTVYNVSTKSGGYGIEYSLIGSAAFGEKRISLTVPLCPGSLYNNFLVPASHTATLPSPPPAPILSPAGDQLALMRFFSIPDGAPSYLCSGWLAGSFATKKNVI